MRRGPRIGVLPARALALLLVLSATDALAQQPPPETTAAMRSGREIYSRFHDGLADPVCDTASSARWRDHFATAPTQLVADDTVLPLFGYVVDALRAASLPTEYALIPFVESGYQPSARSARGPAGLWQMIALTARDHHVPIRNGYDGRLSPVDSTRAAVRYLKTLHGMFAGDWRLAVMAYNAGEYRVFDALRRSHQTARSADPDKLVGLSGITRAYVRKLHALSCLLDQADNSGEWMRTLDHPVPVLQAVELPAGAASLEAWSARSHRDPTLVRRLNPAFLGGRIVAADHDRPVLAPAASAAGAVTTMPAVAEATVGDAVATAGPTIAAAATGDAIAAHPTADTPGSVGGDGTMVAAAAPRTHIVAAGESLWTIARRYRLQVADLLSLNGLHARDVLHPGMVLKLGGSASE